jgi:hypothetical protein
VLHGSDASAALAFQGCLAQLAPEHMANVICCLFDDNVPI